MVNVYEFKTSKGSFYEFVNHTTRRYKSDHSSVGHSDMGLKDRSELTIFVNQEDAKTIISNFINRDKVMVVSDSKMKIVFIKDNDVDSHFEYSYEPELDKCPFELNGLDSSDYGLYATKVHMGNKITELNKIELNPLKDLFKDVKF